MEGGSPVTAMGLTEERDRRGRKRPTQFGTFQRAGKSSALKFSARPAARGVLRGQ